MNEFEALYETILDRKKNPEEGSYTAYLFDKGLEKILKKVGEENTEVIIAALSQTNTDLVNELGDLFYHIFVLMEMCIRDRPKPSKKNSHVPVLIALGVLVGLLGIGGVGYFMYSNHQHQQEIARLEQEKEQEKEARRKAEEEADDLQDKNEYLEDRNDRLEDRQKDENESEDHYPVSYTHLDVYKRQCIKG